MREDDILYLTWMVGMIEKEKHFPAIVSFWADAIREKLEKIEERDRAALLMEEAALMKSSNTK